jgi:hypothetical protein
VRRFHSRQRVTAGSRRELVELGKALMGDVETDAMNNLGHATLNQLKKKVL